MYRNAAELFDAGMHDPDYFETREDCEECCDIYLVETKDGKIVRVLGRDGGEPEDQSFNRNFNWVASELNKLVAEQEVK